MRNARVSVRGRTAFGGEMSDRDVMPGHGTEYGQDTEAHRLSALAREMQGSEILRIAAEVRERLAAGGEVCNLTVGDFSPSEFRIPAALEDGVVAAVRAGESNYPPPNGIEALRRAIRRFAATRLGVDFDLPGILVTSGARPAIYALFRAVVDAGDRVVYAVPSWNNNYYCQLVGAQAVAVPCTAATNFQPTAGLLRDALRGARLLALNSPMNPTGTLLDAATLGDICDLVLEENARRRPDERPLYVMYDQVYWMLTFGGEPHVNPVQLRPEMAEYTVLVDAISKAFAATGLRVGWALGPADLVAKMGDISTHVGAWAPRAEQVATARLLADDASVDAFVAHMREEIRRRLDALAGGLGALASDGYPVETTRPQGAMYLSARFALHGWRTADGEVLRTNAEIGRWLLREAGFAAVPFQAFGGTDETGWFRLSVGAVSVAEVERVLPRLSSSMAKLWPPR